MAKPKINAKSLPFIAKMDEYIRRYDIHGTFQRFADIAADTMDGWAYRSELDDLIKHKLLTVIPYTAKESGMSLDYRASDRLCGKSWTVNPTERFIRTFWPERLEGN